jgi:hypothetical protein
MKAYLCAGLAGGLLLIGCNQKSDTPPASTNTAKAAISPADAPAGYLGALAKGQQSAVKTIDTASLDQAIQLFQGENGRNPKDLNELIEKKFISKIPDAPYGTKIVYDAETGTVKVVKQ